MRSSTLVALLIVLHLCPSSASATHYYYRMIFPSNITYVCLCARLCHHICVLMVHTKFGLSKYISILLYACPHICFLVFPRTCHLQHMFGFFFSLHSRFTVSCLLAHSNNLECVPECLLSDFHLNAWKSAASEPGSRHTHII